MKNPFTDFKTTEMPIEKIQKLFVSPRNIEKIYSPNASFITGQRGSGKTMFMRYVESNFKINSKDKSVEYICVYLRFDRLIYGSKCFLSDDLSIFFHHVIITLLKRLVNQLSCLYSNYDKKFKYFPDFSRIVCETFFDYETRCQSFEELISFLEKKRLETMFYVRNYRKVQMPTICDYSECFSRIVEQLHKEDWLHNVTILFLLDEYENIVQEQRRAINGLIKSASYGYTFKVFHRPIKLDTQVLDSDEHLMVQHDIMKEDFYEDYIGGDKYYSSFMRELLAKRIAQYYSENGVEFGDDDLNIEQYLSVMSTDDEFNEFTQKRNCITRIQKKIEEIIPSNNEIVRNLLREFSCDVFNLRLLQSILEKKTAKCKSVEEKEEKVNRVLYDFATKTTNYKGWVANYKRAVLYLLCFENQSVKRIAGWDQILKISNGIARHVINILYYTFENKLINTNEKIECFTIEEQTKAIAKVAEQLYRDIIKVPVLGKAEIRMIQYYGSVFQLCHKDSTLKKWEVNHFVINKDSACRITNERDEKVDVAVEVDKILDAAITWGHLIQRKVTKQKNKKELAEDLSAYQFHPLLSVYFGISWRQKQRYETDYSELYFSSYGEKNRQENYRRCAKKILGKNYSDNFDVNGLDLDLAAKYNQLILSDFFVNG